MLAAPTNVSAVAGTGLVTVSWDASVGATSYRLYWDNRPGVSRINGTRLETSESPFVHHSLANGAPYYYVVTAVGPAGESAESEEVSATPTLTAPANPSAVVGNSQVTLYWTVVPGADSYNVYWDTTPGVTTATGAQLSGVSLPYIHLGLVNDQTYYYVITAIDGALESAASVEVSATPRLPAPTGLTATPGDGEVELSWDPVDGATGYNLYSATDSGVTPATGTLISDVTSPHLDDSVTNGTTYYYVVTAFDATSESAPSSTASARPGPPEVPTGVTATAGHEDVTLTWSSVAGATGYNIYWSTSSPASSATGTQIPGASSPHLHEGLSNGTTYFYVVTALGPGGESADSVEVSATPQLFAPTGLEAVAGNGQVTLSWEPSLGAIDYTLYWSTSTGVSQATGNALPGLTSPYTHSGIDNGTTHFYVVTARDALGESDDSSEASALPRLPAPLELEATSGDEAVTLAWQPVAGATSYNLYWSTSPGVAPGTAGLVPTVSNPFTRLGLNNGTEYYWAVTAVDATDESEVSEEVAAIPGARLLLYQVALASDETALYMVRLVDGAPGTPLLLASGNNRARFDFSPDGSKLWYHANSTVTFPLELFVIDTTDGTAGIPYEVSGTFYSRGVERTRASPDGGWLAFEADQDSATELDLYLVRVALLPPSIPVRVTTGIAAGNVSSFGFTPDGSRLLFLSEQGQIHCVDLRTSIPAETVQISGPNSATGAIIDSEIGRDGTHFIYRGDLETDGFVEAYVGELLVGCNAQYAKVNSNDEVDEIALAPTGEALAYRSDGELYVTPTSSLLQPDLVNQLGTVTTFSWSRDGARLFYLAEDEVTSAVSLFASSITAGVPASPVELSGTLVTGGDVIDFTASRDSQWVTYRADQVNDEMQELWVVDLSGPSPATAVRANDTLLPGGEVFDYSLAHRSQSLLFTAEMDNSSAEELFILDLTAEPLIAPERVTPIVSPDVTLGCSPSDFDALAAAYAEDDTYLLYLSDQQVSGRQELYLVDLSSSDPAVKVNGPLTTGEICRFIWAPLYWANRDWQP